MWHLTGCKISNCLLFLKWNDFYHISELMLPTLIQGYDKNLFIFDPVQNERLLGTLNFTGCQMLHFMIVLIPYLGWLSGAKVCSLRHRGVQLILAYSWTRPAIFVAVKGRRGMFLFLLFLHFHSRSSFFPLPLFQLLYYLFYLFSPFLWETTQNDPQGLTCH